MSGRRFVSTALRTGGMLTVLGFLGWRVWRVRYGLGTSLRTVGLGTALFAGALALVGGVPGMFGWRMVLSGLGTRLELPVALRVYFLAGLTRYLPGGVWPAVAHAALARTLRQPPGRLAGAFLASQALAVVAGLAVGLLALPRLVATNPAWWLLVPAAAATLVPLAHPRLLAAPLAVVQRILRRGDHPVTLPDRRTLFAATGLMALGWLVSGAHVAVLAVALGAPLGQAATIGIGGFALSVVAGVVTIVMPSGLGPREVVLGLTLATLLTGSELVTVVALSRVLITVGDLLVSGAVLATLAVSSRAVVPRVLPVPPRGVVDEAH
jgi:uncharacterized membrane protein YbhN (UPF0104 family)